ncbi:hypothetical protein ACVIJ6_001516 [Bradyrhizobium sp. USDA 4369]
MIQRGALIDPNVIRDRRLRLYHEGASRPAAQIETRGKTS